jgi:hypothetical protein
VKVRFISLWNRKGNNGPGGTKDMYDRFHNTRVGRSVSVEPLIGHIKDVFKTDPLPIERYQKGAAVVQLSVLIYQIMVYYN